MTRLPTLAAAALALLLAGCAARTTLTDVWVADGVKAIIAEVERTYKVKVAESELEKVRDLNSVFELISAKL